jgi:hypothetical protein
MNTPKLVGQTQTDALRSDLRPSKRPPRPIPYPEKGANLSGGGQ